MRIEFDRPLTCSKESLITYFELAASRIQNFLGENRELHFYYQTGQVWDDNRLFRCYAMDYRLDAENPLDMDDSFTTVASTLLSKVMGYELVLQYLEGCILKAESRVMGRPSTDVPKGQWTDSQSALIELAYALHARGCVDHGKGDVKDIITILEFIFQTNVGNFHRTFQNMRLRKKTRTVFLDALRESIETRMDDTDEAF